MCPPATPIEKNQIYRFGCAGFTLVLYIIAAILLGVGLTTCSPGCLRIDCVGANGQSYPCACGGESYGYGTVLCEAGDVPVIDGGIALGVIGSISLAMTIRAFICNGKMNAGGGASAGAGGVVMSG